MQQKVGSLKRIRQKFVGLIQKNYDPKKKKIIRLLKLNILTFERVC